MYNEQGNSMKRQLYETNMISASWNPDLGLTKGQWRKFIAEMSYLICDELVNNQEGFELPYEMGLLLISGNKGKPRYFKKGLLEKNVKFRNNHSGEYAYKANYLYGKNRGKFEFSHLYNFRTSEPLRIKMGKKIKSGDYSFYEFETINDVYRLDVPVEAKPKKWR